MTSFFFSSTSVFRSRCQSSSAPYSHKQLTASWAQNFTAESCTVAVFVREQVHYRNWAQSQSCCKWRLRCLTLNFSLSNYKISLCRTIKFLSIALQDFCLSHYKISLHRNIKFLSIALQNFSLSHYKFSLYRTIKFLYVALQNFSLSHYNISLYRTKNLYRTIKFLSVAV